MIPLSIEPELMEDAVLCAERTAAPALVRMFRRQRNPIYEMRDAESREEAFRTLARTWFDRFGLRAALQSAIDEHTMLDDRVSGCRIVRAAGRSAEGADLLDPVLEQGTSGPWLVLRLTAESLLAPDSLRVFLRHELMHVTDMLDASFGYQRTLPKSDDGPSADNMLRDRYRVVWDVTIDGRLTRAGYAPGPTRDRRWREFSTVFAALGAECPDAFEYWWSETHPTHAALLAFATAPGGSAAAHGAGRCPFCQFPVASLDSRISTMATAVAAALRAEHPSWHVEQGICSQCFDLYEARYGHADVAAR